MAALAVYIHIIVSQENHEKKSNRRPTGGGFFVLGFGPGFGFLFSLFLRFILQQENVFGGSSCLYTHENHQKIKTAPVLRPFPTALRPTPCRHCRWTPAPTRQTARFRVLRTLRRPLTLLTRCRCHSPRTMIPSVAGSPRRCRLNPERSRCALRHALACPGSHFCVGALVFVIVCNLFFLNAFAVMGLA